MPLIVNPRREHRYQHQLPRVEIIFPKVFLWRVQHITYFLTIQATFPRPKYSKSCSLFLCNYTKDYLVLENQLPRNKKDPGLREFYPLQIRPLINNLSLYQETRQQRFHRFLFAHLGRKGPMSSLICLFLCKVYIMLQGNHF